MTRALAPGAEMRHPGTVLALVHREANRTLATRCVTAVTWRSRLRGWIGRRPAPGDALWLAPCAWIHTFGMRVAIDVVFCAGDGTVARVAAAVRPGRVVGAPRAAAVCELPVGGASGVRPGHHLDLVRHAASEPAPVRTAARAFRSTAGKGSCWLSLKQLATSHPVLPGRPPCPSGLR